MALIRWLLSLNLFRTFLGFIFETFLLVLKLRIVRIVIYKFYLPFIYLRERQSYFQKRLVHHPSLSRLLPKSWVRIFRDNFIHNHWLRTFLFYASSGKRDSDLPDMILKKFNFIWRDVVRKFVTSLFRLSSAQLPLFFFRSFLGLK